MFITDNYENYIHFHSVPYFRVIFRYISIALTQSTAAKPTSQSLTNPVKICAPFFRERNTSKYNVYLRILKDVVIVMYETEFLYGSVYDSKLVLKKLMSNADACIPLRREIVLPEVYSLMKMVTKRPVFLNQSIISLR